MLHLQKPFSETYLTGNSESVESILCLDSPYASSELASWKYNILAKKIIC